MHGLAASLRSPDTSHGRWESEPEMCPRETGTWRGGTLAGGHPAPRARLCSSAGEARRTGVAVAEPRPDSYWFPSELWAGQTGEETLSLVYSCSVTWLWVQRRCVPFLAPGGQEGGCVCISSANCWGPRGLGALGSPGAPERRQEGDRPLSQVVHMSGSGLEPIRGQSQQILETKAPPLWHY